MSALRTAFGKVLHSPRFTPSVPLNSAFHRSCVENSEGGGKGKWQDLKRRLGLGRKKNKEGANNSTYAEHEMIEVPVERDLHKDELWRPGYRGRTENKRY